MSFNGREKSPEDIVEDIVSKADEDYSDILGGTEVDEDDLESLSDSVDFEDSSDSDVNLEGTESFDY
jgi:hypothetical protein